ncbi:unnamed protein product [Discosporangium mesarthrocarpum]
MMLQRSEEIKRFQLQQEKVSGMVPMQHQFPNLVYRVNLTEAVLDMDIAVPLLYETLKALGCNFMPLFQVEELSEPAPGQPRAPSFITA